MIRHLSGALLISTLHAAENFWDEIPMSPSTTLPAVVLDDYWNSEFEGSIARWLPHKTPGWSFSVIRSLVMVAWPATGRELWQNQFAANKPINMGNSGDITPVMLHRVPAAIWISPMAGIPKSQ